MKQETQRAALKKQFATLFRAMDFVASHFKGDKDIYKRDLFAYNDAYQLLGYAWEFLALRCEHWDGYKKIKDGNYVCRTCGSIKGTKERFILLPKSGTKRIGERKRPNSRKIFPNKQEAGIVEDSISFYGAGVDIDVHNSYKSKFPHSDKEINIAAERIVTLRERGIECSIDDYLINIKLPPITPRSKEPLFGGFPWELKRASLKHFPVLFKFNKEYRLVELSVFSDHVRSSRKRISTRGHKNTAKKRT